MSTESARAGDLVGYARVSTWDQNLNSQVDELESAGCVRVFTEHASGTRSDRPVLAATIDYLRPGDALVVWRLDRLGRSLTHLVETVNALGQRQVGFKVLNGAPVDTSTADGRLTFSIFASLAQFERDLISDRTKAGLAAARARGSRPGRKPSLSAAQVQEVRRMYREGQHTVSTIASILGTSRATVYRHLDGSENEPVTG